MSRIRVNNLPKHATNDHLREFFSQKGEVTDAKVMHSKDGKERHFGFVGFRTEHEANEALKYFNKSFLGTSRITCDCEDDMLRLKSPDCFESWRSQYPCPWSRYSLKKNKTSPEKENRVTGKKGDKSKAKKISKKKENGYADHDPQLQEFLQVMEHRSRSKLWANDAVAVPSLEQYKVAAVGKLPKAGERKEKFDRKDTYLERIDQQGGNTSDEGEEVAEANGIIDDVAVSDTEYFKTKVRTEWSDSESCDNEPENMSLKESDINSTNPSSVVDKRSEVLETGRLFIQNLPYSTTEEELENYFSKFGAISQVHILVDRDTKISKGIAYVLFAIPKCAARAIEEANGSVFQGRLLEVLPAEPKIRPDKQDNNPTGKYSSLTLKHQRLSEKKASEANGNTQSWNSLYMRQDTVVENIARKFGVSKSDLLDRESDDLAVRIALGETHVVAETKRALSSAGINVASSEESAADKTNRLKRSNHVILVKNLPYNTSENELSDMFAKFGSLDKIILPPTKTLALVSFLEPAEARAAFTGLHYKRYKDSPLYLEWAPDSMNILGQTPVTGNTVVGEVDEKRALLEQHFGEIPEADIDPDKVESRSLYITNLNFKTTDVVLEKHFTEKVKQGKIKRVTVRKHVKNGKDVSKGYGFIQFDSADTALKVRKDLQGTVLDGHALILQLSRPKMDEILHKKVEDGRSSTKLVVKNVAFEATDKDLRQLFSPFGQMKLRLPRRIGNRYRGYAFVEYVTKQEAKNALRALSNTHLYGRHLVLEWAKERDGLEELRARTAAQFGGDSVKFSKKRKRVAVLDQGNTKFRRMKFLG